jgi:hypothetical protein
MLCKLLMALGLVAMPAWIATATAQDARPAAKKAVEDDPFGEDSPAASDQSNPFSGPPPTNLRPMGKAAVVKPPAVQTQPATKAKPAAKSAQPAAVVKPALHSGEKAILKAMKEQASFDFTDCPLTDVVAYLQDKHHIPIQLDVAALREAGNVDSTTPVNCSVSGVPLRSALRIMLGQLQLEWVIWSDVVMITSPTKAESSEYMVTKYYDVSDLLIMPQDKPYPGSVLPTLGAWESPSAGLSFTGMGGGMATSGGMGMGGMGMGGGFFAVPPEAKATVSASTPGPSHTATIISCIPVVGAQAGSPSGQSTPAVASQIGSPSCCGPASGGHASTGVQPVPGVGGMGGGGVTGISSRSAGMQELQDMITNEVSPKSWTDGGGNGTISSHGQFLCVTQTFQIQLELKEFLARLRARQRVVPTVVVELQWLWLSNGQYDELVGSGKGSSEVRTRLAVDPKVLKSLDGKVPSFRGRIVCANGQLAHLSAGDRRSLIVGAIPVVGSGVGYQPLVQTPNLGVVAELRPTVVPGGRIAILDVHSTVTRWGKTQKTALLGGGQSELTRVAKDAKLGTSSEETSVAPAGSSTCPVQQPDIPAQQLATTLRVPLGKPVILGGMTFAPSGAAGLDEASDDPIQLYVIATTSVAE